MAIDILKDKFVDVRVMINLSLYIINPSMFNPVKQNLNSLTSVPMQELGQTGYYLESGLI